MTADDFASAPLETLTYEEGRALLDAACRRDLGVSAEEFLAVYDAGEAHGRWGHGVGSLVMLVPFARPVPPVTQSDDMAPAWETEVTSYMDNPRACGAPPNWPHGYLPCGCCNDGKGGHVR